MDVVGDQYCFTGVMREGTGKGRMCAASMDAQRGTVCCWLGGGDWRLGRVGELNGDEPELGV